MSLKKRFAVASGFCLLLVTVGCSDPIFNWMTSSPAPWWYMESEYGGVVFDGFETTSKGIKLNFHLNKYLAWHQAASDGFYLYKATAKVQGEAVLLTVYKCIEYRQYRSFKTKFSVEVPTPSSGDYRIIYNDKRSNYPILGTLKLQ